jgi:Rrf2 family protein
MRVSRAEEYGVRLVMSLAASGGQLAIRELALREGLPEPTVAKVVSRLRRAGLVAAARGRKGGYTLARPAASLSLASVVEAVAGRTPERGFCVRMTPSGGACVHARGCVLRPVWRSLETVIGSFLGRITVADVVDGRAADAGAFGPRAVDNPAGS